MIFKRKRFSVTGHMMLVAIAVLSFCGMAYTANPKPKADKDLNRTARIMEYIDPFSMTVITYSVRSTTSSGSVVSPGLQLAVLETESSVTPPAGPPENPPVDTFLRPLIRVPTMPPCRSPCKPF